MVGLPQNDFSTNYAKTAVRANNIRVVHPSVNSIGCEFVERCPQQRASKNEQPGVYLLPRKDCELTKLANVYLFIYLFTW